MISTDTQQTHFRACHLCEAICGLEIITEGDHIVSIKGDPADPLSKGYLCPKAIALQDLHEDPDRVRQPLRRIGDSWQEISWEDAFAHAAQRLHDIVEQHDRNAVGVYRGNPSVHNYGILTHSNYFLKLIGTHNQFSATSVDQLPHHLVCLQMYGHQFLQPIPDIDRTNYFLAIGYNPLASNGSIMTVPDFRGRSKAMQGRGGKLVVIDPRRSETAQLADQHLFIRPGSDALLLFAMLQVIFTEDRVAAGACGDIADGLDEVAKIVAAYAPEKVADATGIDADSIRQLARDFAAAPSAVCHGRMGVSTQEFGTLCQWAIQLLNLVTGNLDREGGALLTLPAAMAAGPGDPQRGNFGKRHSRVSGYPSFSGEFPVAAMAEEMLTPGAGQLRALVTVAGNPVLSTPNGRQLDEALAGLDFMLSIDPYLNETTRHAELILPPASPLAHGHYDLAFHKFAVRNTTRFNPPLFDVPADSLQDWEIFVGLATAYADRAGIELSEIWPPEQMVDFALQSGPYSAGAGHELALTLEKLKSATHGIDLGFLQPSLAERLCTDNGHIQCAPQLIVADTARLQGYLERRVGADEGLLLIGRRHLRSNNSWMHNSHRLVKGPRRDQLLMHPSDLADRGLSDGQRVTVRSRVGELSIEVRGSEDLMRGVASLPHGFGHDRRGVRMAVAREHAGVSANDLTDERFLDAVSGNAALNGVPVTVEASA